MKRRFLPLFVFGVCLVGFAVGADDPKPDDGDAPVRLKKKNKQPAPEQPKDDKGKDDLPKDDKGKDDKAKEDQPKDVDPAPGAKEDEKEVLERVSRNMKSVEERLINKELNEGTRQLKEDIIKDLDSLIKMAENPPPSGGGGGGANSDPDNQGQRDRQPMNQGGMEKTGQNQGGTKPMKGGNEGSREGVGTPGQGVPDDKKPPKPPDGEDEKGQWGHLPESLRAQMKAYAASESYMSKHQELIREYYRNLAKQGRNKKD